MKAVYMNFILIFSIMFKYINFEEKLTLLCLIILKNNKFDNYE